MLPLFAVAKLPLLLLDTEKVVDDVELDETEDEVEKGCDNVFGPVDMGREEPDSPGILSIDGVGRDMSMYKMSV